MRIIKWYEDDNKTEFQKFTSMVMNFFSGTARKGRNKRSVDHSVIVDIDN